LVREFSSDDLPTLGNPTSATVASPCFSTEYPPPPPDPDCCVSSFSFFSASFDFSRPMWASVDLL